jgi:hypothetical protein
MALYYIATDIGEMCVNIGNDASIKKMKFNSCAVTEITADGHELSRIRYNFKNVPMTNKETVSWFGDIAKFIAGNFY